MNTLFRFLDRSVLLLGLLVSLSLITHFGFHIDLQLSNSLLIFVSTVAGLYVLQELTRLYYALDRRMYFRERSFDFSIAIAILLYAIGARPLRDFIQSMIPGASGVSIALSFLGVLVLLGFFTVSVEKLQSRFSRAKIALRTPQIFLLGFMIPISLGTLLLKLPKATVDSITWVDALFTATSAMCVTGLSAVNLATTFTPFGQLIICLLFQIGGLGIMTLTVTFASVFMGGLGVREKLLMTDLLSEERVGEVRNLLVRICAFTFTIEAIGAYVLYRTAGGSFVNFNLELFLTSVFHAISAFCNVGFSTVKDGLMDPLYQQNMGFLSTIMVLIILGGIGFPALSNLTDVVKNRFAKQRQYKLMTMTTKLILVSTAVLLILSTTLLWLIETRESFQNLSTLEQWLHSAFFSVVARTAGFNIFPVENLSGIGLFFLMILMWIGGAPMSTAGGVKITTISVALLNVHSQILGKSRIEIFGRQISQGTVNRAFAAIGVSLILAGAGSLAILLLEPELRPVDCIFEVISAMATVGLSRGITDDLSDASKIIISVLMLVGRVGAITALAAFIMPPKSEDYKLLEDNVIVY